MHTATPSTLIPFRWSALIKTACVAVALFILDAFVLNQGFVVFCVILITVFVFLPRAFWVRRRDRRLYQLRLAKAGIYLVTAVAVFGSNALQNRIADRRAIMIGNACLAFHLKHRRYPDRLDELVPEFLPSVPVAKYTLGGDHFFYFSPPSGLEPMLYYEALPPFGRRFYHMETGRWGYLD
jgi:hypothetical protein